MEASERALCVCSLSRTSSGTAPGPEVLREGADTPPAPQSPQAGRGADGFRPLCQTENTEVGVRPGSTGGSRLQWGMSVCPCGHLELSLSLQEALCPA